MFANLFRNFILNPNLILVVNIDNSICRILIHINIFAPTHTCVHNGFFEPLLKAESRNQNMLVIRNTLTNTIHVRAQIQWETHHSTAQQQQRHNKTMDPVKTS